MTKIFIAGESTADALNADVKDQSDTLIEEDRMTLVGNAQGDTGQEPRRPSLRRNSRKREPLLSISWP